MRLEPDSSRRTGEERCYFPDWTSQLHEVREELEADHNSYLAGGYAEEFGYRTQLGASRGVPVLDGEPPEQCAEWRCQAAGMHPGYPIKPYPIAPDCQELEAGFPATAGQRQVGASNERVLEAARETEHHGVFIRVTDRPYERERHHVTQRAAATVTRFVATLVALRWVFRNRRRAA